MIFLWDKTKEFILASKYERLNIGIGEAGMTGRFEDDDDTRGISTSITTPSKLTKGSGKKKITVEEEAINMVQTVVNLVMAEDGKNKEAEKNNKLENQSLAELI